jgi:methionine-rich copper-binding protein CopC
MCTINLVRGRFLLPLLLIGFVSNAQVSITSTSSPYTQNFNTLRATAGTSTTLPTGWRLLETGTNANTSYTVDAGSSTTGDTYSYGTGSNTDRAFGTLLSGSLSPTIGVQLRNSTGQTITSITISYTGEQWRCGTTGRTDQLDFQYSLNATALSGGTWTDVNTLDFVSPSTSTTGAKDGNAAANRTVKTATITGLNITNNALFWLRWTDADASGSDDGLAIDDISIQLVGGDVTPPQIASLNPANAATGVALSGNLVISFNENIQKGTAGNIVVKRGSDGTIVNTTAVTAASVTVSNATATLPFSGLAYGTGYYVEMPAGTFRDLAGNNFAGITGSGTWAFTTQAAPAASVSTSPASLGFGTVAAGATSSTSSFSFTTANLTATLTLTSPAGFQLSRDGSNFSASINYTLAEAQAGQTAQVRFAPTVANTNYSGQINFSSAGLNANQVNLSGNSNTGTAEPLNYYFGNLHAHSSFSDGNADDATKQPSDDYAFAKNSLCFDFLGISEHNHTAAGMRLANWQPGRSQAAAASTATFVGLYGMEWGVISGGGHVIVYGMDSLIGWDPGEYQVFVPKSTYKGAGGLFDILNRHGGNALAYLAHPNTTDYNDLLNGSYDLGADNAVVGSTIESGPAFSTNTSYTNPGTSLSYLSYYRNMLAKGYHVGPTIDHDNHNMTFGRTAKTRLVVMAPSLSENNLLDGMRKMRFYASQDCGAQISYKLNGQHIGSILTQAGAPIISVGTVTTAAVTSIKLMAGVPGSGTAATQLASSTNGSLNFTDNTLANLSQRYYFLDITEADGARIITAPIWYTRNDQARIAVPVTSFFVVNEPEQVMLKWTTQYEAAGQSFTIERSVDGGRTFSTINTVSGQGGSQDLLTYGLPDPKPFAGVAFYRLVQRDNNGHIKYSDMRIIDRSVTMANYCAAYPNPVEGMLNLKIQASEAQQTMAEVYDMAGRRLLTKSLALARGEQVVQLNMTNLQKGSYVLRIRLNGQWIMQQVSKL